MAARKKAPMPRSEVDEHVCSVPHCGIVFTRNGRAGRDGKPPLCSKHYHRARRHGEDVLKQPERPPAVKVSVALPADLEQELRTLALDRGTTFSAIVVERLRAR